MDFLRRLPILVKWVAFGGMLLLNTGPAYAQNDVFKVYLVGDAGEDAETGKTLTNLGKQLNENPKSAVVFLGDNCYKNDLWGAFPYGFKGFDSSELTQRKVKSQLNILTSYKGYVFFIPGNHDWWNLTEFEKGSRKLKMEESFIEANLALNQSIANNRRVFLPKNAKPGPDFVDLNDNRLRIIFIDSYRLIINAFKEQDPRDLPMEQTFYKQLDSLLAEASARNEKVVVTAHHPVFAKGPNSKKLRDPNLFGRIKASNSSFPANNRMAAKIREILNKYPGIYYASGHVHSLQYYFPQKKVHYIVSGAGSKTNKISPAEMQKLQPENNTDYALWNIKGFFEIDFSTAAEKIFLYFNNGQDKCELQ